MGIGTWGRDGPDFPSRCFLLQCGSSAAAPAPRRVWGGIPGRLLSILALLLTGTLAAGCWELDDYSTVKTAWKSGRVVDVVERNRDEVEWLSIRTVEGEVFKFTSEGPLPFLPAHFRQHQVLGQTVKIFYITRGELLVAIHATD